MISEAKLPRRARSRKHTHFWANFEKRDKRHHLVCSSSRLQPLTLVLANPMCEFQSVTSSAKRSGEESSARWHKQKDTVWLKILRSQREVRCQRSRAHTFLAP
jgi:hypothetical protein